MKEKEQVQILKQALEEVLNVIHHDGFYSDVEFISQQLARSEEG